MDTLNEEKFKPRAFNRGSEKGWRYAGNPPAVVDFYADWCAPRRTPSPIIAAKSGEDDGKIHVYKVDAEGSPELEGLFGVSSIPNILFIPMEAGPSMAMGLVGKQEQKKAVKEIMNASEPSVG